MNGIISSSINIASQASKYLPEPATTGIGMFNDILNSAKSLAQTSTRAINQVSISPEYKELLERQMQAQHELQTISMSSNIEKANHEAKMAAIRNIRVS